MSVGRQLFEGEMIRLTAIQPEKDAEVESRWTHDLEYLRLISPKPARPLSASQVKKQYEAGEKEAKEKRNRFDFAIRLRSEDRLVGWARLDGLEWNNATAWLHLAIGDPGDRSKGYGSEALRLLLRYAFHELNLFRVTTDVFEYNPRGRRFLARHGFEMEATRRQAIHRDGRRWDEYRLGLLREDWEKHA
jgi:RimJ/RimL family protein N-acetyltransferase